MPNKSFYFRFIYDVFILVGRVTIFCSQDEDLIVKNLSSSTQTKTKTISVHWNWLHCFCFFPQLIKENRRQISLSKARMNRLYHINTIQVHTIDKTITQIITKLKNSCFYVSSLTTMSFPLFSGIFTSLIAATVLAPDDIPTYKLGFALSEPEINRQTI